MVYFGKIKNTDNEWGFDVFETSFENYIEVDDDTHMAIIDKANNEGKIIKGDKDGNPILVDPPPPTDEEVNKQRVAELGIYLRETDWYVIRYADTGTPVPDDIKAKRQQAREEISALREFFDTTLNIR